MPLQDRPDSRERARLRDGRIEHLLEPEYHGDHLSGAARVLSFRDYGRDTVERLRAAGFGHAEILPPEPGASWWRTRPDVQRTGLQAATNEKPGRAGLFIVQS